MPTPKTYLGDSVYTTFDGHSIVLTTENGLPSDPSNIIYLDPTTFNALDRFRLTIGLASLHPPTSPNPMTIPQLRFVPDSPAPQPRKWNGGLKLDGIAITAVFDDGSRIIDGELFHINQNGTLARICGVNRSLGFALDSEGRIMLSASDPLMQPRAATKRQVCERRKVVAGEWFWNGVDGRWEQWISGLKSNKVYIVAIGATSAPAYPPGCEPVDAPAATVDGMTQEGLDEVLAVHHWFLQNPDWITRPRPVFDTDRLTALTAPAYSRWLERTKGGAK